MKSICLFTSYFTGEKIPYYVKIYLEELANYFSEVVLLTNKKLLDRDAQNYLDKHCIRLKLYENEGMDFGMWYKAFSEFPVENYDRIGLINDSCVLFESLKPFFIKANNSDADAYSMVFTGKFSPHLQSYFILLNKRAILLAKEYFRQTGILKNYKDIIFDYEIGMSNYFIKNGLKLDGFFNYSSNKTENPSYILVKELIYNHSPLIKKKLLNRKFTWGDYLTWMRNNIDIDHRRYVKYIRENSPEEKIIDMKLVLEELGSEGRRYDIYIYRIAHACYRILHTVSIFRILFHQLIKLKRFIQGTSKMKYQHPLE
jgi:lipopolysaccharide biosynthesis protein